MDAFSLPSLSGRNINASDPGRQETGEAKHMRSEGFLKMITGNRVSTDLHHFFRPGFPVVSQ